MLHACAHTHTPLKKATQVFVCVRVCVRANFHPSIPFLTSLFYKAEFFLNKDMDFPNVIRQSFYKQLVLDSNRVYKKFLPFTKFTEVLFPQNLSRQLQNALALTSALHVGISPEELLALAAGAASKARHAVALSCELWWENRPRSGSQWRRGRHNEG